MEVEDGVCALGECVESASVRLPAHRLALSLRVVGQTLGVGVDVGLVVLVGDGPVVHVTIGLQQELEKNIKYVKCTNNFIHNSLFTKSYSFNFYAY